MIKLKSVHGDEVEGTTLKDLADFNIGENLGAAARALLTKEINEGRFPRDLLNSPDPDAFTSYVMKLLEAYRDNVWIPRARDLYCQAAYGETYTEMESKARFDDEYLFKLLRLPMFKNIKEVKPFVKKRYDRACQEKDEAFLRKYHEAEREIMKPHGNALRKIDQTWQEILNQEYIENHTPKEIHKLLKDAGVKNLSNDELTISKNCRRKGFHTGQGKKGKRKKAMSEGRAVEEKKLLDIQIEQEKTLKEIAAEMGISEERVRQIQETAIRKMEENRKKMFPSE